MDDRKLDHEGNSILDALALPAHGDWAQGADDPFSILRRTDNALHYTAPLATPDEYMDPLEELQREAEAVLRNPESVNTYRQSAFAELPAAIPDTSAQSKHLWASTDANAGSLLDLLAGPVGINHLIGTLDSLDTRQLLMPPTTPDVLQLFAGNLAASQRRSMTAELTRREHHLVSMDSAYLPAAQTDEAEQP